MDELERLSELTARQRDQCAAVDCMRLLAAKWATRGSGNQAALEVFTDRWGTTAVHAPLIRKTLDTWHQKTAVAPGTSTDAVWGGPLVPKPLIDPILLSVQQQALPARLGLRRGPFDANIPVQSNTGTYAWVASGTPKPATRIDFATARLYEGKIGGIVVLTAELVRLAGPFSENVMRDALVGGIVAFQDAQLLDPAISEIANVRPKSLTNGVTVTAGTDVGALLAAFYAARPNAEKPVLVMSPTAAGKLAATAAHPDLTVTGGTAYGVPVVTSAGAGTVIAVLDAQAVVYADGGLMLDVSTEAAIEMADSPTAPVAATIVTSFWSFNLAGIRIERMLWWVAAPNAVQYLVAP